VDVKRLERWWGKHREELLFQTDRRWVKANNRFVRMFQSYEKNVGGSQHDWYKQGFVKQPELNYDEVFKKTSNFYYSSRYSLFLLLESVKELTGLLIQPSGLNLKDAESSRDGLCFALGKDSWVGTNLPDEKMEYLQNCLMRIKRVLDFRFPNGRNTFWSIETSLCAYKKLHLKTRYLGYYIDRQQEEILKMQNRKITGVNWKPLWDFRKEYFSHKLLGELNGWVGPRPHLRSYFLNTGGFGNVFGEHLVSCLSDDCLKEVYG